MTMKYLFVAVVVERRKEPRDGGEDETIMNGCEGMVDKLYNHDGQK